MVKGRWLLAVGVFAALVQGRVARGQDAALSSTDFTFTISPVVGSSTQAALSTDQLASFFSLARCACPTNIVVGLSVSDTAAPNLDGHTVDAQLEIGNDCDIVTTTACAAVGGSLTLSATQTSAMASVSTAQVFSDASGSSTCPATTTSSRLWAIVRVDGARIASEPSLAITLGGVGPSPPTAIKAISADDGLLISWTPSGDSTTLRGHQVVCSPAPVSPSAAAYDVCPAAAPDGGVGPFGTLDASLLCSGLVPEGTNSVRVHGLANGQTYQVAVVAVGIAGTPSAASAAVSGTPGPTVGFHDLYRQEGGTATGCALAGAGTSGAGLALALGALGALALRARRRTRKRSRRGGGAPGAGLLVLVGLATLSASARAQSSDAFQEQLSTPLTETRGISARAWNFELRFGPYRPDVDSEFENRGSTARPYAQVFGTSRHLMSQLELDRQISHRWGTWGVGLGVGYFHVSASALSPDLQSPSGDQTSLRLIPIALSAVYRADMLRLRYGSPVVPYAKLGFDCALWHTSDTSTSASTDGRSFGWHGAVGLSLDLSFIDRAGARDLDEDAGVNQMALFFELAHASLDNFGSSTALHVGDTTWLAGLMIEL
ncbi:MAG TPA: MXAN_2562 family outer membrane beta-barrel protein [Polyangia bacterium]